MTLVVQKEANVGRFHVNLVDSIISRFVHKQYEEVTESTNQKECVVSLILPFKDQKSADKTTHGPWIVDWESSTTGIYKQKDSLRSQSKGSEGAPYK